MYLSARFTNLKFTIMDGAGLIFDYAMTEFGPNLGYVRISCLWDSRSSSKDACCYRD